MPPPLEDDAQSPEVRPIGGLAGVFRGLTGNKSNKSPPPQPTLTGANTSQTFSEQTSAATPSPNLGGLPPDQMDLILQLRNGSLTERIATASALTFAIADYPLNTVVEIWDAGKDLIDPAKPLAAREAGWGLLTQSVKYAYSSDLERREYFDTISSVTNPEDFHLQLAALVDLTNNGRKLSGFEYDIFPLLTRWLQEAYHAVKTARRNASRAASKSKGKSLASGEDKNFSQLFAFVKDVVKFNLKVADDGAVSLLMGKLLKICMSTSVEEDLRSCIHVIDAIVTFGTIPADRLKDCVHVLSSIHCLVASLQKDAWHTLANISKSHHGQSTVRILLDVLRTYAPVQDKDKDVNRDVRGALSVLKKLLSKSAEKGYPAVPLALLIDGLVNISRSSSPKIAAEVLKLINALYQDTDGRITALVADEDWTSLFNVAVRCSEGAIASTNGNFKATSGGSRDELDRGEELVAHQLRMLVARIEYLLGQGGPDFLQRGECINFLTQVQHALPDSAVTVVLDYFNEYRCCFPSELDWVPNLELVLEGFYQDTNRRPTTRLQALATVVDVYNFLDIMQDWGDVESMPDLVKRVLERIDEENDTVVLQETVTFLVAVTDHSDADLFDYIIDSLKTVITAERSKAPNTLSSNQSPTLPNPAEQTGSFAGQSLSNVVTKGYAQMFMHSIRKDVQKAQKTFNALLHVARSNMCETDARLTAWKVLLRLRADWAGRVYLTTNPESESLAASLYRTEASLARKLAEDAAQPIRPARPELSGTRSSRGISVTQHQPSERGIPVRAVSGIKPVMHNIQQLWSFPDPDALPEPPSDSPSHLLFSHADRPKTNGNPEHEIATLNMSPLLDAILSVVHQNCEWEVYSFVLVHLPAQLSNHAIFEGAIPQIRELRKVLCELLRMNNFQEPPIASGLRRPDVANCLFHTLAMILSYHPYFHKDDEDDLVRTFTHGIADRTAKTCIHALSVCCHELPMSMSKALGNILTKMSQIITQPFVAMHILEFLACLSRLHSLYSNFRGEDYRIVFGICFRYLQYVRDKKRSMRSSHTSEPSTPGLTNLSNLDPLGQQSVTDDLPQYVYALAYHVITFWFLALRLNDRPSHIGWIAKNLFTDTDGSVSNDEQAQITIDFMQRAAYSDANDSMEDPLFKDDFFGEVLRKNWIIGNSIVTVKQAKESGWAEVTRRYPSGMSSFTIREKFTPVFAHQTRESTEAARDGQTHGGNTTLPSFLLLQLLAPLPQSFDLAIRPIALPADEAVDRAIRLFDMNSALDGHKVGVIYIGENQKYEGDILANNIGSAVYQKFLEGLGTLTRLKGAPFNTQGLDREYDTDGKYTLCWRDRVTEIVFHVTTQMPTNRAHDPGCVAKKRHIGNDFVNIIFNDSGLPFQFDTFPSDFNYVNVVITPDPRSPFDACYTPSHQSDADIGGQREPFFMVHVMSKPGFPEISPAAEPKAVSLKGLPSFVRLLALNASVFSHVWANREGGEHVSSWRSRLREINRLRDKYGPPRLLNTPSPPPSSLGGLIVTNNSLQPQPPVQQQTDGGGGSRPSSNMRDSFSSLRRSSVATFFSNTSTELPSHRSSVLSTATTDNTEIMMHGNAADALVESVDFSKWA